MKEGGQFAVFLQLNTDTKQFVGQKLARKRNAHNFNQTLLNIR